MYFEMYVARHCIDNGKPTQRSGCAITILAKEFHGYELQMTIGQHFGDTNQVVAEIKALWFALLTIKRDYRNEHILLLNNCYFGNKMLQKGLDGYISNPQKNKDDIIRLRNVFDSFTAIHLDYQKNLESHYGISTTNLAKSVTATQKRVSGPVAAVEVNHG